MPNERPRFFVTCPARTGSTMLMQFLQSHPDVCAHGEVLAPDGPLNFYGVNYFISDPPLEYILMSLRDRDPVAFLHNFVWQPGKRAVSGFKGKYEELLLDQYRPVLDALANDKAVKVIHLKRDNLLARYLSQYMADMVHGFYELRDEKDRPEATSVRLSPRDVAEDFQQTDQRHAMFDRLFADHDALNISYEELVLQRDAALNRVQSFLGVEQRDNLRVFAKRVSTRSLRDSIANYDELAEYFVNTPYSRLFAT